MFFKHILVPTDGSELSDKTVNQAIAFAKDCGARITFFCAGQANPAIYFGVGAISDATAGNTFRDAAKSTAQKILDAAHMRGQDAGVDCDTLIMFSGAPWEGIIEAAKQKSCDLIFMASNGRRGVNALLLGSETQKVLTHSKVPVLVYR